MVKRSFDILCCLLAMALLSPILGLVVLRIKAEDGGPLFYRGERTGRHGRPFRIYKFRTMVVDAEKIGGSSTAEGDPRITGIGLFLRKYKLDELPQFINVLLGDMSLVGPRPEVKRYTDLYSDEEKIILGVRPGITDWASIWNADEGALLAGFPDPERAYLEEIRPKKLKLQMKYVMERSFCVDLKILVLTVLAVVRPESQAVRDIRKGEGF
jgi:lipopolysaccharide/colanic/teichoic acid biosynthesis glycosyltransferase